MFDRLCLWLATTLMALIAGFFYAYACSVMPGLATVDDRTFVEAMRGINAVVRNVAFAPSFFGALLVTGIAVALQLRLRRVLPWTAAALVLYAAAFVLTLAVNVPLNEWLATADLADPAAVRARYEGPWITWNIIRTALATLAVVCLVVVVARRGAGALSEVDRSRRPGVPGASTG
ncbi:putative membrane protein [Actinokineospora baliensis]|uniref:anthrone oxygenase family protein n=1 Tax=Actinokineospora baliensis TaxID=547056 RepID=UPI0027DE484E|nr:anthrone oxygenase family protein [Actinokineospora baliensis]MBM7774791.1 putative membrane protein [Actinokineospora baliensis]